MKTASTHGFRQKAHAEIPCFLCNHIHGGFHSMAVPIPTLLFMAATQPASVTNTHHIRQSILACTDINTQKG